MLKSEEFICPMCGRVLDSPHDFRRHVAKEHEPKKEKPQ